MGFPYPQRFVQGPFVARSSEVWQKLRAINPLITADDCFLEFHKGCDGYFPTSPDDLVELIAAPAYLPASWIKDQNHLALRAEEIQAAIQKLTDVAPFTTHDLDVIFYAARAGHSEAAIIMSDFKRFGRSMNRRGKKDSAQD